ncbi:MAG: sugar phosphate isomerase/epimerase [Planctomycetota bacterium]|nr:sugar phosphate isomerase/epimerase [Planctomycetota bacterium]
MRFAICNELYQGWKIEDVFAHAAKAGYAGVEIAPFTLADDVREVPAARRKEIRRAAAGEGLEITGLHWLLLKPAGLHINHPDGATRKKTEAYVEALIELCADLGGSTMVWGSPKQRYVQPGDSWLEAWKRTVDVLRRLGAKAHARGVTIAFEPLGPADNCNFVNTTGEGSLLVREVDSPGVRLHLDVKAMKSENRPVAETIRLEGGTHLHYFHANDPNLRGPGMGEEDFKPILRALKDVGYDGWVSVEVFDYEPGPDKTASISLKTLKDALTAAT